MREEREWNKTYIEGKKLGSKGKRMKVDSKGKSLMDDPRLSERGPDVHFQYSPRITLAPHYKMAFPNKKAEMKEKEAHTILGQLPQRASRWNNVVPTYHSHIAHTPRTLYP